MTSYMCPEEDISPAREKRAKEIIDAAKFSLSAKFFSKDCMSINVKFRTKEDANDIFRFANDHVGFKDKAGFTSNVFTFMEEIDPDRIKEETGNGIIDLDSLVFAGTRLEGIDHYRFGFCKPDA